MSRKERPRNSFDYGYLPSRNRRRKRYPADVIEHRRSDSEGSKKRSIEDSYNECATPSKCSRFDREYDTPSRYRGKMEPYPLFMGYQLVGDSLLLRFAEQVLFQRCIYGNGLRYLGLCVSGQTIQDLTSRISNKFSPLGENIILLIGTNNMLQGSDFETMKSALKQLLNVLLKTVKKIIILTIPPIPKLEKSGEFWYKYSQYNRYVKSLSNSFDKVFVVDITGLYLTDNNECDMDYYEGWYDKLKTRPDRIHLNRSGLIRLREKIWKSEAVQGKDEENKNDNISDLE